MKQSLRTDLKKMKLVELVKRAQDIRKELFVLRMKKLTSPEKNTALARNLRKALACTLTFVRQRELYGES